MKAYLQKTNDLLKSFSSWTVNSIDRSANQWANALSKLITTSTTKVTDLVYFRELEQASITEIAILCIEQQQDD